MMKVYVAGPMRGIKDFNFPAFEAATKQLTSLGHEVFSPANRDVLLHGKSMFKTKTATVEEIEAKGFSLRDALGADTEWICANADAVALLPGWRKSLGAKAEAALGKALGIRVDPIDKFIPRSKNGSTVKKSSSSSR